ncbi:central glycolytic genes regulator [Pullulanibacillus pueri]|uniref:Central glycolytic genes regulator n=1 Tax=Pullulanibacillus pueri TaxID=1437324 RepID=A0A8J3ELE8_9BACL|nr:sugar-binding transcriptional regulator [Pullulanibacillus pueri]MBM7680243.1 central glycolytic genes regulator [Pullulanibacillus pueri]GGH76044.1 central glycolytic genes regulator [Pullulanibacillus pueri]
MDELINIQRKLVPDVINVMSDRFRILQSIHFLQPIGRRALSAHLGLTERVLRGEVAFLGKQGLVQTQTTGMTLTDEGERVLGTLDHVMKHVSGITELEKQLKKFLHLSRVVIVPGNSDEQPWVQKEMGLTCVRVMESLLSDNPIIAIAGGTTLAAVADMMHPFKHSMTPLFVSARGGLGEQVENQANTICAKMAEKADGSYRMLHVPDQLSEESYLSLIEEPSIRETLALVQSAGMVIHGIGDAKTMAKRRRSSQDLLKKIDDEKAVAEAFGYYFDKNGKVIHKVKTIGLQLEELYDEHRPVIAVAGGESKANAIEAYFKKGPNSVLVTDEGAAQQILNHRKN